MQAELKTKETQIADLQENLKSQQTETSKAKEELISASSVMEQLKKVDEVAYVRFASVYRQFTDVNTFIKEIEKLIGKQER